AFVLTVLVVADDDHLALADVFDRLFDRGERGPDRAHQSLLIGSARGARPGSPFGFPTASRTSSRPTSLSTYFASTSTSRLTAMPGSARPRLVRSRVSGINDTVKDR